MGAAGLTLLLLAGCAQTATAPSTTLAPLRTIDIAPTTTVVLSPQATTDLTGYVNNVADGRTFDISVGPSAHRGLTVAYIEVPPAGTCEGDEARNLLAALIFGKQVSIDAGGFTFLGDIDVGLAMIQYGQARPTADAPGYYQEDAKLRPDFDCANTTTSTTLRPVVVTRPRPRPTTPPTEPVAETIETTPIAQPPVTDPPPTEPRPTDPPATEPARTEPDRTPKEPKEPKLPETPAPPASG